MFLAPSLLPPGIVPLDFVALAASVQGWNMIVLYPLQREFELNITIEFHKFTNLIKKGSTVLEGVYWPLSLDQTRMRVNESW